MHEKPVQPPNAKSDSLHNPDNLTDKQVGVEDGWRLLNKDEIRGFPKSIQTLNIVDTWNGFMWVTGFNGCNPARSSRTRLSRAELRSARGLEPETILNDNGSAGIPATKLVSKPPKGADSPCENLTGSQPEASVAGAESLSQHHARSVEHGLTSEGNSSPVVTLLTETKGGEQSCQQQMVSAPTAEAHQGTISRSVDVSNAPANQTSNPSSQGQSDTPKRQHLVPSAGYWFNGCRDQQRKGNMSEAVMCMANAYNHVENALADARAEVDRLKAVLSTLTQAVKNADSTLEQYSNLREQLTAANARADKAERERETLSLLEKVVEAARIRNFELCSKLLKKLNAHESQVKALEADCERLRGALVNSRGWIQANANSSVHGLLACIDSAPSPNPEFGKEDEE